MLLRSDIYTIISELLAHIPGALCFWDLAFLNLMHIVWACTVVIVVVGWVDRRGQETHSTCEQSKSIFDSSMQFRTGSSAWMSRSRVCLCWQTDRRREPITLPLAHVPGVIMQTMRFLTVTMNTAVYICSYEKFTLNPLEESLIPFSYPRCLLGPHRKGITVCMCVRVCVRERERERERETKRDLTSNASSNWRPQSLLRELRPSCRSRDRTVTSKPWSSSQNFRSSSATALVSLLYWSEWRLCSNSFKLRDSTALRDVSAETREEDIVSMNFHDIKYSYGRGNAPASVGVA